MGFWGFGASINDDRVGIGTPSVNAELIRHQNIRIESKKSEVGF